MSDAFPRGTVVLVREMGGQQHVGHVIDPDPDKGWQHDPYMSVVRVPGYWSVWLCMDDEIYGVVELPEDLTRTSVERWLDR